MRHQCKHDANSNLLSILDPNSTVDSPQAFSSALYKYGRADERLQLPHSQDDAMRVRGVLHLQVGRAGYMGRASRGGVFANCSIRCACSSTLAVAREALIPSPECVVQIAPQCHHILALVRAETKFFLNISVL